MLTYLWATYLFLILFVVGSVVGSFLNVCIARLPHGLSLLHPPSRCGACLRPIRLRDNLPLVSYWLLRGRCRACGAPFSMRYFWVELLTGLAFMCTYYLELGKDVHHLGDFRDDGLWSLGAGLFPRHSFTLFPFHAVMVCFLIVAVACLLEARRVPRSVMLTGVVAGLIGAVLFPWPRPLHVAEAVRAPAPGFIADEVPSWWGQPPTGPMPADSPWWSAAVSPRSGFYSWPVWGPLPEWLPAGSVPLGLATGLAGVLAGAVLLGAGRLMFNASLGETGIVWGDAGLLMIAGGFLGWQPALTALLIAPAPWLVHTFVRARRGRGAAPLGLWLGLGLLPAWLGWSWIGPYLRPILFNVTRLAILVLGCWAALLMAGIGLRAVRPRGA